MVIISENFRNKSFSGRLKMMVGINRHLVSTLNKSVDTLFYPDKEWEEDKSFILQEAKYSGLVIYG